MKLHSTNKLNVTNFAKKSAIIAFSLFVGCFFIKIADRSTEEVQTYLHDLAVDMSTFAYLISKNSNISIANLDDSVRGLQSDGRHGFVDLYCNRGISYKLDKLDKDEQEEIFRIPRNESLFKSYINVHKGVCYLFQYRIESLVFDDTNQLKLVVSDVPQRVAKNISNLASIKLELTRH